MEQTQKTIMELQKEFSEFLALYSAEYMLAENEMCGNKQVMGKHISIHLPFLPRPTEKTTAKLKEMVEKYFGNVRRVISKDDKCTGCSKLPVYRTISFEFVEQ
ncbi:MAG: hypothetical protein WC346_05510 [Methanogenium sp.]|jgi:hypothetical protein